MEEWYRQPIFDTLRSNEARFERLLKRCCANEPQGLARSLRLMGTGAQPSLWDDLSAIRSRLLVLAGFLDAKYMSIGEEIAASCRSATFSVVDDAGHNAHLENGAEFVRQLRQFFAINRS